MRVVAENSEADLARQRATAEVRWALREMTANLLRVVRGAGKPHEIVEQAHAFFQALVGYHETVGTFLPAHELASFLAVEHDLEMLGQFGAQELRRADGQDRVMRGALQIAASRLIGQATQEQAGKSEMYSGIREIEAVREESRRAFAAASAADRSGSRTRVTRPWKPRTRDS